LLLVTCTTTSIDSARWWHSPRAIAAMGLSTDQTRAIDDIFSSMLAARIVQAGKARAAKARLDRLFDADVSDAEFEVAAAEAADAEAGRRRLRTLMLYRIFRVLSSEQRSQIAALGRSYEPLEHAVVP
jgi:hypothetical protein